MTAFAAVCGGTLALVVALFAVGGVAAGDEAEIAGLLAFMAACVLACIVVMLKARIVVTGDGRLVVGALRIREIDLTSLQAVRTPSEQPALGDRPFALTLEDRHGQSVTLPMTFTGWVYDREADVLCRVAEAVERAQIPLSGVVRNYLSQAAQRPVGQAAASRAAAPATVVGRVARQKLWLHGAIAAVVILFPLGPLLGGAVGPDAPAWVQPGGVAAVGAALALWLAIVTLHARRRLVIDESGRMRVDGLVRTRSVRLDSLRAMRLAPDKAVYERTQHVPPAGRLPRVVITDQQGREVRLPAGDHWHPAHAIFDRVLAAAEQAGLPLSEPARATLRYLAGRAEPRIWTRRR